jgi:hypothetical protein
MTDGTKQHYRPPHRDIKGHRFGRLIAQEYAFYRARHSYWKCVCDCGEEPIVLIDRLLNGQTKSCGCYRRDVDRKKRQAAAARLRSDPRGAFIREQLGAYKNNATRRGIDFDLTFDQFDLIGSQPCHYCGTKPPWRSHKEMGAYFNGIDRADNTKGYTTYNCVPACWWCNRAKAAQGQQEFLEQLHRVAQHQGWT